MTPRVIENTYADGVAYGVVAQISNGGTQQQPGEDIWLRILQEVSSKNNAAVQGSLLLLGNERAGKSSLVARLANGEPHPQSSVLEYNFMQVQADADASYAYQLGGGAASGLLGPTDQTDLPIWVLDGKEECAPLLDFTFPPNLAKCMVCLCASLEQPGNILPALSRCYRALDEQIRQHYQPEEIVQARQAQIRFWQEYMEPIESSMAHSTVTLADSNATIVGGGGSGDQTPLLLPPEKGVLDENCGAMLCVVITKSDTYMELSAEQLDRLQYHVRKFCLRHGATLFYTSAKEDLNTQLLNKYIAHRMYSLPFTTPAYIVEKDRIFVPAGWDSDQKLSIIKETLGLNLDVPILPQEKSPAMLPFYKSGAEKDIEAEDEQAFLNRLNGMTLDGPQPGGGTQSPRRGGESGGGKAAGDNTMLANFFSSLLKDKDHHQRSPASSVKSGHGGGGGTISPALSAGANAASSGMGPAAGVDPEAHFQRMLTKSPQRKVDLTAAEDDNEDQQYEDAYEGDESGAFSSSVSSQNVTPRDGDDEQVQKQPSSMESEEK